MQKQKQITIFIIFLALFLPLFLVFAGTIISPHQYAWSNNVGYINFANVIVNDSTLTGYAWSKNKGFIIFNPAHGGVLNNGQGNLSGSAWGDQLGWIDFSNTKITNGKFSGTATGTLIGTLTFDCPTYCDVQTDWRPQATPNNAGGSIYIPNAPSTTTPVIPPNVPNIPNVTPPETTPVQVPTVTGGGVTTPITVPAEKAPLFDVVVDIGKNIVTSSGLIEKFLMLVVAVLAGSILSILTFFIIKKVKTQMAINKQIKETINEKNT